MCCSQRCKEQPSIANDQVPVLSGKGTALISCWPLLQILEVEAHHVFIFPCGSFMDCNHYE